MKKGEEKLGRSGFTIIELMVALVLSFILIGGIYGTFRSQQKSYTVQDQVAEAQQNARMAMNLILRDIRMGGYGMPDGGISIGGTTFDNAIQVDQDKDYDSITLVGAFGSPSGFLARTVFKGSTTIHLRSSDEASDFDTYNNRYIFIGGIDKLSVMNVENNEIQLNVGTEVRYPTAILTERADPESTQLYVNNASGLKGKQDDPEEYDVLSLGMETIIVIDVDQASAENNITVDTDPDTAGNQGIIETYPAGTIINPVPVYRVTALQYCRDYYGTLTSTDIAKGTVAELAGNIHDIEINQIDPRSYLVEITVRTNKPDPDYVEHGGYRLRPLQSTVTLRNL